ncbi:MAG: TrbC/VirB2 family protein [bacterium]|nr:TrbC/VirB2 family protein [bacterium]
MKILYKKRKTQNEKRKTKNFVSLFIVSLFLCFFVVLPAFAQTNDLAGLSTFQNSGSGLATTDIRITIGNIIRIFLGLLGTIAIVLILYAGFMWMTAAGNEEKIEKAKKILTNAVIGLVLILAAFGIVSFIISSILSASSSGTITDDGSSGVGIDSGELTRSNSFTVESVQPNSVVLIREIVVRLNFTRDVDATTVVPGTITVTKDADPSAVVEGDLSVNGQLVTFTPKTLCFPADLTKTQKCFDESTKYVVEAKTGIKSTVATGAKSLQCGSGFSRTNTCKDTFTSGTEIDDDKPVISINLPTAVDGFVSANAEIPIDFTAKDNNGVSYVTITDGDNKSTTMMPGAGIKSTNESPWQGSSINPWSTIGKTAGPTEYTITGQAFDIDSNIGDVVSTKVKIRAAHCFDKKWNTDLVSPLVNETGIDCGPPTGGDCGACPAVGAGTGTGTGTGTDGTGAGTGTGTETGTTPPPAAKQDGAACTTNAECAGGACQDGKCVTLPRIDNVFPLDGKAGALVTITGQAFGTTPGEVLFLQANVNGTTTVSGPLPSNCSGAGVVTWEDDRIIVAVPAGLTVPGPIKVTEGSSNHYWDNTVNTNGKTFTFTPSTTSRPGLCSITPTEDEFGKPVVVQGVDLNTAGWGLKIGVAAPGGTPVVSADGKSISGVTVPKLSPGIVDVTMTNGSASSNSVLFTVKEITKPIISAIIPFDGGPIDTYVTLSGRNFGTTQGVVYFEKGTTKIAGSIDFPSACLGGDFWTPESVTVKVPNVPVDKDPLNTDVAKNEYDVYVSLGSENSDPVKFKVKVGSALPGICRLDPDNGPAGLKVEVSGDHFGTNDAKNGKVVYNGKTGGIVSWSDQSVMSQVPIGATTGLAQLVDSAGTNSNKLPFTVQDCRSGVRCGSGDQCCGDGSCRTAGTCTEAAAACTFAWKFTTGATPGDDGTGTGGGGNIGGGNGTCGNLGQPLCPGSNSCAPTLQLLDGICQDTMPHVIEDVTCATDSQSPSPYKDTKDACKEAQIAVRFTMDMHDPTLVAKDGNDNIKNVVLTECNGGGSLVLDNCKTPVGLTWVKWLAHDEFGEGAVYKPKITPLKAGTWYRVTLKGSIGEIAGKDGALLDGNRDGTPGDDYAWTFLTRGANDTCSVDKVLVSPGAATITAPNATQDFSGLLVGPKCNLLDDTGYVWQWTSAVPAKATVAPANQGQTTARSGLNASAETTTPIDITAKAKSKTDLTITYTDKEKDEGKLTIRFAEPTVIAKWPDCGAACSNAEVGVQFSLPVSYRDPDGSVSAVKLYACQPLSGVIATLKTTVETQSVATKTDGDAAIQKGTAAFDLDDIDSPTNIPAVQIDAASTAAIAARKAATSALSAKTAVAQLMTALGDKKTPLQQAQEIIVAQKVTAVETQAIAAEGAAAAPRFSARAAGAAAKLAGEAAQAVSIAAAAIANATVTTVTECTADKLLNPAIPIRTYTYNPTTHILRFYPQGGLIANTAYRVLVKVNGIKGAGIVEGKNLEPGSNAFSYPSTNGEQYYSWKFTTKKAPATCALADVSVEPASYTSYVTGEKTMYSSVPFGAPDACSPAEGQRLDPLSYSWNWTSSKESVGKLFLPLLNLLPAAPQGPDNNIDPEQQIISVGVEQGKTEDVTDVQAGTGGKEGKGALKVVCGFGNDSQCNAFSLGNESGAVISCTPSQTLPDICGVANNTCCGIRPKITAVDPSALVSTLAQLQSRDIRKDACPNAALSITFDQPMDPATLSGNVRLSKAALNQGSTTEYNFTSVVGSVDGKTVDGKTIVTFFPKTRLVMTTPVLPAVYRLEVNGDAFGAVTQSNTDKIRNIYGVALAGIHSYFFVTKPTLCAIDHATISVIPPVTNELQRTIENLDRFTCGGNNCPGDQSNAEKNQHTYTAKAYDKSKPTQELTIESVAWSKNISDQTITLSGTTGKEINATSLVKNGEAEVTAEVSGRPEEGKATKTLRVVSFICENPWPSLAQFPWTDPNTHMELSYCRDAGSPGRADDLPELQWPPIAVPRAQGESNFLEDFLLPVNE